MAIRLWDGREYPASAAAEAPRIHIHDRRTLWKLAVDPWFQFGEAYSEQRLDVEGDFPQLLTTLFRHEEQLQGKRPVLDRLSEWWHSPRRNTLAGSRDNVHHHYDLGNDFYRLWLDEQLVYTCAYFPEWSCPLEAAQVAKLRHVCRKLRLRKGETVLEAGCGWGGLALYMARHYGVTVKAFNISREQLAFARQRAKEEGLAGRVEFIEDDWRNMTGPCDAFVSVGMMEHLGRGNFAALREVIKRCVTADGRGLIHTIGRNYPRPLNSWIERRIFPGAYPPTLAEIAECLDPIRYSLLDVENLRPHYTETLRHWLVRFEQSTDEVRSMFDEKFIRMWRLYLCGSLAAFASGCLQLYQVLFAGNDNREIPFTRADIYQPAHGEQPPAANGKPREAQGRGSI